MKKYILIAMLSFAVFSLAACTKETEPEVKKSVEQETKQKENKPEEQEADGEKQENNEETELEKIQKISVKIYTINPEDGTLVSETKECEEVNEKVLWDFLKETGSVPQNSEVLSLKQENGKLLLDVDQAFGEQLRTQGTTGENEMMGCVVNTFLDAYACDEIKITEEGQVLESGHREYAEYMTKFEI